jgi:hypothetical protein
MIRWVIAIVLPVVVFAQEELPPRRSPQSATLLNGSSQYWSKATPTGMDFGSKSFLVLVAIKPDAMGGGATGRCALDLTTAGKTTGTPRLFVSVTDGDHASVIVGDSSASVRDSTASITRGRWGLYAIAFEYGANIRCFMDGTLTGTRSVILIAKQLSGYDTLRIGTKTPASGALLWDGSIGPVQVIRFDALPSDIASVIAYVNATWRRRGFPKSYTGGTIVLDVDWKTGGNDKSGTNNHLTPTASPGIVKIR